MAASRKSKVFSLSLAQGILTVSGVMSSMVFTRVLSKDDYATYLQTFLAYDFLQPVLTLGLPLALYNLLPGERHGKKVVLEVMLLLFAVGTLFSVFMFFGGTDLLAKRFNNPELSSTLRWLIPFPLYTFPLLCLSSILVVNDKVNVNSKYSVYTGLGRTLLLIIVTLIGGTYLYPIATRLIYPALIFPIGVYLSFKYTEGAFERPDLSSMWRILKFSIPLGLATTLASLSLQLSNMIVSSFCSPSDYAVYSTGAKEIPFISIITGAIAVVIMADMSNLIKKGNVEASLQLFRKGATTSAMFLMPIMVFLFIYGDLFIKILYSDAYSDSVIPFRIYLFYLPIRIVQYNSVYIAFGQSKAVLFRTALELFFTILYCVIFVWLFGYWGAALGAILALYLWGVPYNIVKLSRSFGCKKREVLPFDKVGQVFLLSFVCGLIAAPCLWLNMPQIPKFVTGGVIYLLSYYLLMNRYFKDFKELVYPVINKIRRK